MVAEFIHAGSFVGMPSPTPVSQPLHGTSGVASRRSRHPASRAGVMTTQAMGIKLQSGVRFHQQSSPKTAIFTFPGAIGTSYRIEDSPDMNTWSLVESGIAGNGSVIQRFYSTRNMARRYFRVSVE